MKIKELVERQLEKDNREDLSSLARALSRLALNGRDKDIREMINELDQKISTNDDWKDGFLTALIVTALALDRGIRENKSNKEEVNGLENDK